MYIYISIKIIIKKNPKFLNKNYRNNKEKTLKEINDEIDKEIDLGKGHLIMER